MTMDELEKSILADLEELDDILLRSEFLLRCGKLLEGIPETERREEDLVRNCQTKTWLRMDVSGGCVILRADSLSMLVRGALAVIDEIYNGRPQEEIREHRCSLIESPFFRDVFSGTQMKGIETLVEMIHERCK